jgi:hypothetical protein
MIRTKPYTVFTDNLRDQQATPRRAVVVFIHFRDTDCERSKACKILTNGIMPRRGVGEPTGEIVIVRSPSRLRGASSRHAHRYSNQPGVLNVHTGPQTTMPVWFEHTLMATRRLRVTEKERHSHSESLGVVRGDRLDPVARYIILRRW